MGLSSLRKGTVAVLLVVVVAACSETTEDSTSSTLAASTTSTTVPPAPPALFVMSDEAISDVVDEAVSVALSVSGALSRSDADQFTSLFTPDATFKNPISPLLEHSPMEIFDLYSGEGSFDDVYGRSSIYVNVDGVISREVLEVVPIGESAWLDSVRQLNYGNGLVESGGHWLSWFDVTVGSKQLVDEFGLPPEQADEVVYRTDRAKRFIDRLAAAWASMDPSTFSSLYAYDAVRVDPFAGIRTGWIEIEEWFSELVTGYPELQQETSGNIFVNAEGPAVIYNLTLSIDGRLCEIGLISTFELDNQGLITNEHVYYQVGSVLSCN